MSTGIGSQTLILSGTGTLAGKNAGSESLASLGTLSLANGTGLASNYTLIGGTDAATVTPATLTYTAGPVSESYGTTPAGLSGAVSGFLGSDSLGNATTGSALFSTAATASSNVGSYAITGGGLSATNGNYTFVQAAGNATALGITPAIVNLSGTRTYDAATDATGSIFGSGGTVSTGIGSQTLILSGTGTLAGKNAGSESLASLGTLSLANGTGLASNYTLIGGTDAATVTPATLTYSAGLVSESYGTTPAGLSGAVSGFLGSDSLGNATTGSALFSTAATASSNVGSYAITGGGLSATNGNYTFVQAAGNCHRTRHHPRHRQSLRHAHLRCRHRCGGQHLRIRRHGEHRHRLPDPHPLGHRHARGQERRQRIARLARHLEPGQWHGLGQQLHPHRRHRCGDRDTRHPHLHRRPRERVLRHAPPQASAVQ